MLNIQTKPVPIKVTADGVARIGGTRVTLDTVVGAFNDGATAEEIVQQYPALHLADVYSTIAYYLQFREDVDTYIIKREAERDRIKHENEAKHNPVGIRERLLARRKRQE